MGLRPGKKVMMGRSGSTVSAVEVDISPNVGAFVRGAVEEAVPEMQEKWGVSLNKEDRAKVVSYCTAQTYAKMKESFGAPVHPNGRSVRILVKGLDASAARVADMPQEEKGLLVGRRWNQWRVCGSDDNMRKIRLGDFDALIPALIRDWARTGVKYAVGSHYEYAM